MKRILIFGGIIAFLIIAGLVLIIVKTANKPPVAASAHFTTREGTPVSIKLEGSDPDGDILTFSVISKPSHGSLQGTEPNLIYTPEEDFNGEDVFSFRISDGRADSNDTTISITAYNRRRTPSGRRRRRSRRCCNSSTRTTGRWNRGRSRTRPASATAVSSACKA